MTDVDIETQLTDHLRRRAEAANPRSDLAAVEEGIASADFVRCQDRPNRRPLIVALVSAAAAGLLGVAISATLAGDDGSTVTTDRATTPTAIVVEQAPFVGAWVTIEDDGNAMAMTIEAGGDGAHVITVEDTAASVCSGAPSTMTGTGRVDDRGDLVIAAPMLTCADGSQPEALSGPTLAEQLRDLTFSPRSGDTLEDSLGLTWERAGAPVEEAASGVLWPQSSIDEVRQAQELADAGDPAFTWQLAPQLSSDEWWGYLRDPGAEIVERFLREELGWDQALFSTYLGDDGDGAADGVIGGVVYLRCSPGDTNPLYPIPAGGDALGGAACAPTIDELLYETVSLDLTQPARTGSDGVWVVSRWAISSSFAQADPRVVADDATARLEEFLQARIDGEGAEGLVDFIGLTDFDEVPLLYTTTTGAPYERFEIERLSGPLWPRGDMEFEVRLFAELGQSVVEQQVRHIDDQLFLDATSTAENGQPMAVPYGLPDARVTLSAAAPWELSWRFQEGLTLGDQEEERFVLVGAPDPLRIATGCEQSPAPADAATLAAGLQSDPALLTTAPVDVTLAGVGALVMDLSLVPNAKICEETGGPGPGTSISQGDRMRLYLVDLPEGAATRILAIAIVAPEMRFDAVVELATPIIESIEFDPEGS